MAILTGAVTFMTGMSANALMNYKNLRILPEHKHETIPTWGTGENRNVIDPIARNVVAFHRDGFKSLTYEGLGMENHQEYLRKRKDFKEGVDI